MAERNIVLVDYGMGNLRSVQKALEKTGFPASISADPQQLSEATHVILPGVGAFRDAIEKITQTGLHEALKDHWAKDKPFLGICLGLQLLFEWSHEGGKFPGLGFFKGEVVHFTPQAEMKIPHMGWNDLQVTKNIPLLDGCPSGSSVYFVHSYFAVPEDPALVAAWCDYGGPFAAVVGDNRRMATQFHPEKSQRTGLEMLQRFAQIPW
ncbi:MAG: imidazole glycerol phosphate synthase subunit HisH [Gemmataceae bacterium]|nr:imidazole glycerol phosphate synthase subunit HisH [Gemmataceae bacterium]